MNNCCYVTGYFDIDRSNWKNFSRTFDEYLENFKPFIPLFTENKVFDELIVFIDDRHLSKMEAIKSDNIKLIPINEKFLVDNLWCWQRLETERNIMKSDTFKSIVGQRIHFPECSYPEYTSINHCKIDFVSYVIQNSLSLLSTFAWVDFGFFSKKENIPKKLLDLQKFDMSRVNYTLINKLDNRDSDVMYTLKNAPERVGGFFFLGSKEVLLDYQKTYHDALREFADKGICDDDQGLVVNIYFKNPSMFSFNKSNFGWHKVLVANQRSDDKKKVISFCLWGQEKRYTVGLIENIKLVAKYYPGWYCYIYIHNKSYTYKLKTELSHFIHMIKIIVKDDETIRSKRFMLWRLEPLLDKDVELFISRDIDTRIFPREVCAVREWIKSGKDVHIMRDHPQHYNKILGGMYGMRCCKFSGIDWIALIENYYKVYGEEENDQHFLEKYVYNMTPVNSKMIHDEIKKYEGGYCLPFPLKLERNMNFVGCYVYEDDSTDELTERVLRGYLKCYGGRINNSEITFENKMNFIRSKIDKIYIVHYTKLRERKVMMTEQLESFLFDIYFSHDVVWVDKFDREYLSDEECRKSCKYSDIINRDMTKGEIANMIAHEYIFNEILKKDNKLTLVLEDDCIFKKDFVDHFYQTLKLLESKGPSWDMCCLGGPLELNTFPARALDKSTEMVFESSYIELFSPSSPAPCTVSSMLYTTNGIRKISGSKYISSPYKCPSDHALWLSNMENNVNMTWVQPFITYEGSKNDLFKTSFLERGF